MTLPQFLFRFRDENGDARDLQVSIGSDDGYRLSVCEKGELVSSTGEALAVPIGDTVPMITQVMVADAYIPEIYCNGNSDGLFSVYVGGVLVARRRTDIFDKDVAIQLYRPFFAAEGSTVRVDVTNTGVQIADYETILYKVQ